MYNLVYLILNCLLAIIGILGSSFYIKFQFRFLTEILSIFDQNIASIFNP
jgi:hypothetical protein